MRYLNIFTSGTSHIMTDSGVTACGKTGWGAHRTTERPAMQVCPRCSAAVRS